MARATGLEFETWECSILWVRSANLNGSCNASTQISLELLMCVKGGLPQDTGGEIQKITF